MVVIIFSILILTDVVLGVNLTNALNMNGQPIENLGMSGSSLGAARKWYVDYNLTRKSPWGQKSIATTTGCINGATQTGSQAYLVSLPEFSYSEFVYNANCSSTNKFFIPDNLRIGGAFYGRSNIYPIEIEGNLNVSDYFKGGGIIYDSGNRSPVHIVSVGSDLFTG